jgi:hypothetical protein
MQGCIYTAQGEIVCEKGGKVETFVEEKQNIPKNASGNASVDIAMKQNYCDIKMEVDPATGKTVYSFKKECPK